jgi:peptidoglycan hydrolase CwlO-like protein
LKKQFPAFVAAFIMTALIALVMGVVTVNALVNKNSTPVANSVSASTTSSSSDQAQIAQLQDLVNQYQQREQQYQQREQQYQQMLQQEQSQLDQANQQINQFQQFLGFLQQQGLISITNDGRVRVNGH